MKHKEDPLTRSHSWMDNIILKKILFLSVHRLNQTDGM